MSRSRRRLPISGRSLAESDRAGKVASSRALRRRVHQALATTGEEDALPAEGEIRNPATRPKDGKVWHGRLPAEVRDRIQRK